MGEGEMREILSIHPCGISRVILYAVKSYDMGPPALPALLPIQWKVCCGFLSPLKYIASAGLELANLGSSGKYTSHYTTDSTWQEVTN
jgi:hypothetical protein